MKKITLSIALLAATITGSAQDTTCTMVTKDKVFKFNYYTDEILRSTEHTKGSVFIDVGYHQVECLHLFDDVNRVRKVILTYDDGTQVSEIVNSKSNVYYATGPVRIEVKRPKIFKPLR
tara:strand:- start:638 stop:994 length:357 start_codon:yes stop_codon:yes gene_type:complete